MKTQAFKKLSLDLVYAQKSGKRCIVLTTQRAAAGVLFEIEQLDQLNKKYFQELEILRRKKRNPLARSPTEQTGSY